MQPVLPIDHQVPFVQIISLHWHLKIAHFREPSKLLLQSCNSKIQLLLYSQHQLLEHTPFFKSQIKTPTRAILMLVRWLKPCEKTLLLLCCHNIFENKTAERKTRLQALVSKCHLSVKSNPNPPLHSSDPVPHLSWRWPWLLYRAFKFWLHPAPFCFSRLGTGGHTQKELVTGSAFKFINSGLHSEKC